MEDQTVMWGKGYIGITPEGQPNPDEVPELNLESRMDLNAGNADQPANWVAVRTPPGTEGLTVRALGLLRDAHADKFGTPPVDIGGSLERTNLEAFQQEYALGRMNGLGHDEAAQNAIKETPFGKGRIAIGYGDFKVNTTNAEEIDLGKSRKGVELGRQTVPTSVTVSARQSRQADGVDNDGRV